MKRRNKPPSLGDILSGKYDSNFLVSSYQELFIGYSNNKTYRGTGTSGGIGSELACFVLEMGLVDAVIGVGFSVGNPSVPEYQAIEDQKNVDKLTGSKYVYMEFKPLSHLLALIKDKDIAVFVQPCFVKAIRSYQKFKYPNIKYIFSFFCGYNIAYEGTEYLIRKTRINEEQVDSIAYRWGNYPGGFMVKSKDGKIVSFGKECYELIDLMFLKTKCKNCSYYMGEGADVVLGDAWIKNLKNASVVITRSDSGSNLIKKLHSKGIIKLYGLKETDLIKMHWHNLRFKKYGFTFFLNILHVVLSDSLARKVVPFKLMMLLSRIRRRFAIGVNVNIQEIRSKSSSV